MDFSLTPEQRAIQALARDFADAEIAPRAAGWDRDHSFPREVFAKLGELQKERAASDVRIEEVDKP